MQRWCVAHTALQPASLVCSAVCILLNIYSHIFPIQFIKFNAQSASGGTVERKLAYWYTTPALVGPTLGEEFAGGAWFIPHTETVNNVITTSNTDLAKRQPTKALKMKKIAQSAPQHCVY
jgi:hypothetical protein